MPISAGGLAGLPFHEIEGIRAVEYCRSPDGSGPASEVHLIIRVHGVACPLIMRYDQAKALDDLIASLTAYRAAVWPLG